MRLLTPRAWAVLLSLTMLTIWSSFLCSQLKTSEGYDSMVRLDVPFHRQIEEGNCATACLEMIFDYFGEDVPQNEITEVTLTTFPIPYDVELVKAAHFSNLSTSAGDVIEGNITGYSMRGIGYAAFMRDSLSIDDLKRQIDGGSPIVVLNWMTSGHKTQHYRLVIGYNSTHILTHDPHYGANKIYNYSTFLDLWKYSDNLAIFASPWIINLETAEEIKAGDDFTIAANITYPCPTPFDKLEYPADSCCATLDLPDGLELAQEEKSQHFLGNMSAASCMQTSWRVHALTGGEYNISVTVLGKIEGKLGYPPYKYYDHVGGKGIEEISVLGRSEYNLSDAQVMLAVAGATLAIVTALFVVAKRLQKSK